MQNYVRRLALLAVLGAAILVVASPQRSSSVAAQAGGASSFSSSAPAWAPIPAPSFELAGAASAWTGTEWLVWGGETGAAAPLSNSGGRYSPSRNVWESISQFNAPSARRSTSGVWTGDHFVVWGGNTGNGGAVLASGGRYEPLSDTWRPTAMAGAPAGRHTFSMVWTGSEVLVWGGSIQEWPYHLTNTGGRYDPVTDSWNPMSLLGAPTPRVGQSAVWTGRHLLVWGGWDGTQPVHSGGKYDPVADTWETIDSSGPLATDGKGVWTGSELLVWGYESTSDRSVIGAYNPESNRWSVTATETPRRYGPSFVWTGESLVVWGGWIPGVVLQTGFVYDPSSGTTTPTPIEGAPQARASHIDAWTGQELLVWGGFDPAVATWHDGGRLTLATGDTTPPTISASATPLPNFAGWNNTDVVVSYTCTDADSGVDYPAGDLGDDVLTTSGTATGTCVDNAGNEATATHDVLIDKTPPVFGEISGPVAVSVPASQPWTDTGIDIPAGSLVQITGSGRIRIAGSDPGKYPDGRTFDYEQPGTECGAGWVLQNAACWSLIGRIGAAGAGFPVGLSTSFTATTGGKLYLGVNDNVFGDNSGAWSAAVSFARPGITPQPLPNAAGWNNTDVTVNWACQDALSGVDLLASSLDADVLTATGTAMASCTDRAGNTTLASYSALIDKAGPTLAPTASPPANSNGWNHTDVVVSWTCTDGLSGVDPATSSLQDDLLTESGSAIATCRDLAGNTHNASYSVFIDRVAPTVMPAADPLPNVNGWNNTDVTVSYNCTDAPGGSGIDYGASDLGDDVLTASGTAVGTCVDNAGNSAFASYAAQIDSAAPTISIVTPVAGAWYGKGAVVYASYSCADETGGSGVASCVGSVVSGFPIETRTIGARTFVVTATDYAGNVSTSTVTYNVGGKDECKNGGWVRFLAPVFANQGDCVSWLGR